MTEAARTEVVEQERKIKAPFTVKDELMLLMKEYDALRLESTARVTGSFQCMAVSALIVTWLLSHPFDRQLGIALAILIPLFLWVSYLVWHDSAKLGLRLKQLERQINAIVGVDALQWERKWGGTTTGMLWKWPPNPYDILDREIKD
jgi:hypothetical protein